MERINLKAEIRENSGKGHARSLRRNGLIPCVIYRKGKSLPIQISKKDLVSFVNTTAGEQVLVNLKLSDGKTKIALIKDYQSSPVKGELLHTDFYEVSLKEKVKVHVAVSLIGVPIGVKRDAGILQSPLREIEIECLPGKIPSHLEMDVSSLEIGHSIHVNDVSLEDEVKLLTDPDEVLATVLAPAKVIVEEEEVEEEAVEEAVEEEGAEPEVIKKGKKEEGEEG